MLVSSKEKCCICYDPDLDKLIYQSKEALERFSIEGVKARFNGFSCDKKADHKSDLLQNYLRVLEDEYRKISLGGEPCIDCKDLQTLSERVRKLSASCNLDMRRDVIVDLSGEEAWIAQNPYCVSREDWERLAYIVCAEFKLDIVLTEVGEDCDLDLEVTRVEQMCDITFEIIRKIIPCDIMIALSIREEMCDLSLTVTRTEEECELDFNILISEVECDIDLETYIKLVECNLSFDVIKTVYENGCSFEIDENWQPSGQGVNLVTPLNTYPIDSLKFKGIPNIESLEKLSVDLSDSEYVQDPGEFIKKIKQDYSNE